MGKLALQLTLHEANYLCNEGTLTLRECGLQCCSPQPDGADEPDATSGGASDDKALHGMVDKGEGPSICAEALWEYTCSRQPDFDTTFTVYQHFKDQGYTVKPAMNYGGNFVLYEGAPELFHSRFVVLVNGCWGVVDNRPRPIPWSALQASCRLMPAVCKSLLVCTVTKKGDGGVEILEHEVSASRFKLTELSEVPEELKPVVKKRDGEARKKGQNKGKRKQQGGAEEDSKKKKKRKEKAERRKRKAGDGDRMAKARKESGVEVQRGEEKDHQNTNNPVEATLP
ncbi:unnamed protein product [Chrysoparadoxa australica]